MSDLLRGSGPLPPPGPTLASAIGNIKPVRTRVPARTLTVILGIGLIVPLFMLAMVGPRLDLGALPRAWVVLMGLVWALAALAPLLAATVPPRGEVLASAARAGRIALGATLGLLLLAFFATVDRPGRTVVPGSAAEAAWHCLRAGLQVVVPVLVASLLLLRRAFPIGGRRIAAAIGTAGGALGGLTLHFICPIGGGMHVALGHAGGMIAGALLGMLVLPRFLRS